MLPKYREVLQSRYGVVKDIGEGQFGVVVLAHDFHKQNMNVAIKIVGKQTLKKGKLEEYFHTEKKIMEMIDNPYVVRLLDHFETVQTHFLVMEYCNDGDLYAYIKRIKKQENRTLSEDEAREFLKQLLLGFLGLHEIQVMHRDLKLKNILVQNGKLKIADFGLSILSKVGITQVGTPYTRAPEVYVGMGRKTYTNKADIWSLGIIFYQLLFNLKYPFEGKNVEELYDKIKQEKLDFQQKYGKIQISKDAQCLLKSMLKQDPNIRINWNDLYNHNYLAFQNIERLMFDPVIEELITQFQLVRLLQSRIFETLFNLEILRVREKNIANLNTYYVQFMLAKRLLSLNKILNRGLTQLGQRQKKMNSTFKDMQNEANLIYAEYRDCLNLTQQNLSDYIERNKQQNKEYDPKIEKELQDEELNWHNFLSFTLNYYCCIISLAERFETKNQYKALDLFQHACDLLQCLKTNDEFTGVKLKNKTLSTQDISNEELNSTVASKKKKVSYNPFQQDSRISDAELIQNQETYQGQLSKNFETIEQKKENTSDKITKIKEEINMLFNQIQFAQEGSS